ncbi:MAG: hypothetical protein ACRCYP_06355 [Alphaproteobacteria bacterium]
MKFLHKKWLLLSCALLVTNPLRAMMQENDDEQTPSCSHSRGGQSNATSSSYECLQWDILPRQSVDEFINFFYSIPEETWPKDRLSWKYLKGKNEEDVSTLLSILPRNLHPEEPMDTDESLEKHHWFSIVSGKSSENVLNFVAGLSEKNFHHSSLIWSEVMNHRTVDDIIFLINGLPQWARPEEPLEWDNIINKKTDDVLKLIKGIPKNLLPKTPLMWNLIHTRSPEDVTEFFLEFPDHLKPNSRAIWNDVQSICRSDAEKMANFMQCLPDHLKPNVIHSMAWSNSPYFDDPRWSPEHENSISVLAPAFFAANNFVKDEFEAWLSLAQFDRDELLEMCARGIYFEKIDLLMPEGLGKKEEKRAYLQNVLFPGGKWIWGDLEKAFGFLLDTKTNAPARSVLSELVREAISASEQRIQRNNQTIHSQETEEHFQKILQNLNEAYAGQWGELSGMLDACKGLSEDEREDAKSTLNHLKTEGMRQELDLAYAAAKTLSEDKQESFFRGFLVRAKRMYNETKNQDGMTCLTGLKMLLPEALSGIHPGVPLFMSEGGFYDLFSGQMKPFIEKVKAEGKDSSQFWELFKKENLFPPRKNLDEAKRIFDEAKEDFEKAIEARNEAEQDLNEETEQKQRLEKKQILYKAIDIVREKERALSEAKQTLDETSNEAENFERAKQAFEKLKADVTDELLNDYFEE